jgi:hypothetical protein
VYAAGLQIEECDCSDARFDGARLDGARLVGLMLRRTTFIGASLRGAKIGPSTWEDATIEAGDWNSVKWTGGAEPPLAWMAVVQQGVSAMPTQGRPFDSILTDRLAPGAAGDSAPPRALAA